MELLTKNNLKTIIIIASFLLGSNFIYAQEDNGYEKAKAEIIEQLGTLPSFLDAYPKYALAGVWENYKQINGPNSVIPPKYRELIQLAVASQIPCEYCVYVHKSKAKALGANEEEMKEAVAHGAQIRQWSMILQASETKIEDFKIEIDGIIKYTTEKRKNKTGY